MTERKARKILGNAIGPNGLYNLEQYLRYHNGDETACLDAEFTVEELEAIAFMMRKAIRESSL